MIQQIRPNFLNLASVFVVGAQVPKGAISLDKMKEGLLEEKYPSDYFEEIRIKPGELSALGMTSGTTGFPKLVRKVGFLGSVTRDSEPAKRYKVTNEDVFAALAPLSGGGSGPPCRFHAQSQGCKVALLERFDPEEALKLIEREKVTFATGVPAQLTMMVRHPNLQKYDMSSLRAFYYAGAKLPYSIAKEVEEKMCCRIVAHFGGMDVSFAFTTSYDDPIEVRLSSVGKLVTPGAKLKLVDEEGQEVPQGEVGELMIKEVGAGSSYYKDNEATRKRRDLAGWYHTGDLGKLDEHGNLYIVGRSKDVIIRGGQNIYPAEIEGMLITNPKVADVAIVSMPDPIMGEKACAYVIPRPSQILTFEEMASFLAEKKIAKYKVPERLEIVDSFPMSGDGQKVLKRGLAAQLVTKLKAEGVIEQ
jgi:non-ribosomal peptide synthetase component E (peptide arylation enzyme)